MLSSTHCPNSRHSPPPPGPIIVFRRADSCSTSYLSLVTHPSVKSRLLFTPPCNTPQRHPKMKPFTRPLVLKAESLVFPFNESPTRSLALHPGKIAGDSSPPLFVQGRSRPSLSYSLAFIPAPRPFSFLYFPSERAPVMTLLCSAIGKGRLLIDRLLI